ncbi:MAG: glycosyltransferase [Lachnospiraceae bacterium]|nr:glycosyltransferase [Lachnospiraceae bacterium]
MKILVYEWNGFCQKDLRAALLELGHRVERIGYVVREQCGDAFFEEKLAERLKRGYDMVISFNYYPSVGKCCHEAGIPYLSWIYDGDIHGIYHTSAFYDTNYIFTFDRAMLKRLKEKGLSQVWYLPLGVNTTRLDAIPYLPEEQKIFGADISFIGNLYRNKNSLDSITLSDYDSGYLEAILKAQVEINFNSLLEELLTPELIQTIAAQMPEMDSRYTLTYAESIRNLMATAVTKRERQEVLKQLSEHYEVSLYTFGEAKSLPKVKNCGIASYFNTMPRIFKHSKINLNMTHRMIFTGIPLRIMDVLGVGGFLMTDYQSDMEGVMLDGEHLAIYYSVEDLIEKVGFYLEHPEERKRIAQNGYRLAREEFALTRLLPQMFTLAGI